MIIEFSGLPRSGKSSTIDVIKDFLARSGIRVRLSSDRAHACPFSTSNRIEFASWVANSALSNILEIKFSSSEEFIYLQDRGLFDAIGFFRLLMKENLITETTYSDFVGYFINERWTNLVDIVILFYVEPRAAIERDIASKIMPVSPPPVITNELTMTTLKQSFKECHELYGGKFNKIVPIDTTNKPPLDIAIEVLQIINTINPILPATFQTRSIK